MATRGTRPTDPEVRLEKLLAQVEALALHPSGYQPIAAVLARLAVQAFCAGCTIHVSDDDGLLRCVAVAHVDPAKEQLLRERLEHTTLAVHPAVAVEVLQTGRLRVVAGGLADQPDMHNPEEPQRRLLRELGDPSAVYVPLQVEGRALGVICFWSAHAGQRFGRARLARAANLARCAALAIAHVRSAVEAQRAEREARGLYQAALAIGEEVELAVRLERVLDAALAMLQVDQAQIALLDEREQMVEIVAARGECRASLGLRMPLGQGMNAAVVAENRTLRSADLLMDPRTVASEAAREEGLRAWIGAPLRVHGRAFGVLAAMSSEPGRFTEADEYRLEALAALAGVAVHEARMREQLQATMWQVNQLLADTDTERARLQQVLDVLPEGMVILDRAGRVVTANAAALDLLGGALADPGGRSPAELLIFMLAKRCMRLDGTPYRLSELPMLRAILHGEVVRGEQLLVVDPATTRTVPLLCSSAPLRDASGRIYGAVAAFQEISTLKDLELQKDEFIAAISHDLKNPLSVIRIQVDLLQRQFADRVDAEADRLNRGLGRIVASVGKIDALVSDLLDVARLRLGRPLPLERGPVDLVALARQVAEEQQQGTRRHRVVVQTELTALVGEWDERRLERALSNLVVNAIKYSPPGRTIVVAVDVEQDESGRWARLAVRDQGLGIPAEDLPQIFERFRRGRNVGSIPGMGIGLATVRQTVSEHGGSVEAESIEGQGTTITIRLPLPGEPGEVGPR